MLTAKALPNAAPGSLGVGPKAAAVNDPPNPNLGLSQFLVEDQLDPATPVFDAASWARVAESDASWASASWAKSSWESASWAREVWGSASWARDFWASASRARDSQELASWAKMSWDSVSYEDNSAGEEGVGGQEVTPEELAEVLAELGIPDPFAG